MLIYPHNHSWHGYSVFKFTTPTHYKLADSLSQSVATMTSFVFAMVCNPEVFKKAQEEIDRVIGQGRLPDLEDRTSLPFLDCVLKEVLRSVFNSITIRVLCLNTDCLLDGRVHYQLVWV